MAKNKLFNMKGGKGEFSDLFFFVLLNAILGGFLYGASELTLHDGEKHAGCYKSIKCRDESCITLNDETEKKRKRKKTRKYRAGAITCFVFHILLSIAFIIGCLKKGYPITAFCNFVIFVVGVIVIPIKLHHCFNFSYAKNNQN